MLAGLIIAAAPAAAAAAPPATWDGLVQVPSKRAKLAYLQPGADFSGYTKVLIDTPEVAFEKNWRRNYNSSTRSLSSKVSDSEVERAVSQGVTAAGDIFAREFTKAGYTPVDAPGPDVLRVHVGIVNIRVSAPDRQTAGRSHTFSNEAGSATLFIEARDSTTGALLGRAVDQRLVGDNLNTWRTAVSNRGDFRALVQEWAGASARALNELKSRPAPKP
jgi:hypothetical protein